MAGLLQHYQGERSDGLAMQGYLANLEAQRNAANQQTADQMANQRSGAIGSGIGKFIGGVATGNPIGGAILGGLDIIGGLF